MQRSLKMDNICIDGNNLTCIAYSTPVLGIEDALDRTYSVLFRMLDKLKQKYDGNFYVCWDTKGGTTFRKQIDSKYKATRDPSKFDFTVIEKCKSLYEDFGIKSISIPQCEGDDALFVLCKYLRKKDPQSNIVVISRDKDLLQIVQKGYANTQYDPVKKSNITPPWYDVVKYKALVGDSSDNISGVKGIGQKAAIKIISGMKTLTEEQETQYQKCLKLVDATMNPNFEKNYSLVETLIK